MKAMKRIAEIKQKREHAFWRHRCASFPLPPLSSFSTLDRMAAAKEKLRAHRKKKLEKTSASTKLVQPIATESSLEKVREKIKVAAKSRSALVPGEGRSMAMDID